MKKMWTQPGTGHDKGETLSQQLLQMSAKFLLPVLPPTTTYYPYKKGLKVKVSLCFLSKHHTMKVYWGKGGTAPLILWPWH
jgi:hypothetical protein